MTEQEFSDQISAKFPYRDEEAATALIRQGWELSPNAAFCVLHEISRPPLGADCSTDRQNELLDRWLEAGDHTLKPLLVPCAGALINSLPLPWQEAVEVMKKIDQYPGQYAALAIAYFSGDCDSTEGDAALNHESNLIRRCWANI